MSSMDERMKTLRSMKFMTRKSEADLLLEQQRLAVAKQQQDRRDHNSKSASSTEDKQQQALVIEESSLAGLTRSMHAVCRRRFGNFKPTATNEKSSEAEATSERTSSNNNQQHHHNSSATGGGHSRWVVHTNAPAFRGRHNGPPPRGRGRGDQEGGNNPRDSRRFGDDDDFVAVGRKRQQRSMDAEESSVRTPQDGSGFTKTRKINAGSHAFTKSMAHRSVLDESDGDE